MTRDSKDERTMSTVLDNNTRTNEISTVAAINMIPSGHNDESALDSSHMNRHLKDERTMSRAFDTNTRANGISTVAAGNLQSGQNAENALVSSHMTCDSKDERTMSRAFDTNTRANGISTVAAGNLQSGQNAESALNSSHMTRDSKDDRTMSTTRDTNTRTNGISTVAAGNLQSGQNTESALDSSNMTRDSKDKRTMSTALNNNTRANGISTVAARNLQNGQNNESALDSSIMTRDSKDDRTMSSELNNNTRANGISAVAAINMIPMEELQIDSYELDSSPELPSCWNNTVLQMIGKKVKWFFTYLIAPVNERQTWKNSIDGIMSLIGYTVGLGNIWRFPYFCYKYGGATFLTPYFICLFVIGLPEYFMVISLGQYLSLGPTNIYASMAPLFTGLGWAMVTVSGLVAIYYNVVIAWSIVYIYSSFDKVLPWSHCQNDFNIHACSFDSLGNKTYFASKQFFEYNVLRRHLEPGTISEELVISLCIAWFIVILSLIRGIRTAEKVVYVTVAFPYIVLILLLAWSYLKFNAQSWEASIHQYFSPSKINGTELMNLDVWTDAGAQVLFTLGNVFGGYATLSSYNKLHQNTLWTSLFIVLWDSATSLLCGCVVFASLSELAFELGWDYVYFLHQPKTDVGVGVVFIAYPALLGKVKAPMWSILFFLMILTLGIDSMIGMVETISTALSDNFQPLRRRFLPLLCTICVPLFLLGLPFCTPLGINLVEIMHEYTCKIAMVILNLTKIFVVCYIYGFSNFMKLIREELRIYVPKPVEWYLKGTLMYIAPLFYMVLMVWELFFKDPNKQIAQLPIIYRVGGWLLAIVPCLIVPAVALWVLHKNKKRGKVWRELLRSTKDFKPFHLRQDSNKPGTFTLRHQDSITGSIHDTDFQDNRSNSQSLDTRQSVDHFRDCSNSIEDECYPSDEHQVS